MDSHADANLVQFVPTAAETYRRRYLEVLFALGGSPVVTIDNMEADPFTTYATLFGQLATVAGVALFDLCSLDNKVRVVCWAVEYANEVIKAVEKAMIVGKKGKTVSARLSQTNPYQWDPANRLEVEKTANRIWNPATLNPAHPAFNPDPILQLHTGHRKNWSILSDMLRVPLFGLFDESLRGRPVAQLSEDSIVRDHLRAESPDEHDQTEGHGYTADVQITHKTSFAVRIEVGSSKFVNKLDFYGYVSRYELPKSATPSDDWLVTPYGVVTFDTAVEAKALVHSVNSDDELTRAWLWDPADPTTQVKVTYKSNRALDAQAVCRFLDHARPRTGYAPIAYRKLASSTILLYESPFAAGVVAAIMDGFRPNPKRPASYHCQVVPAVDAAVDFSILKMDSAFR